MKRGWKLLGVGSLVLVGAFAAAAVALNHWVGTEDFRLRVNRELSAAAGLPVELARIRVDVWPLPAVAVEGVQVQSRPRLRLEHIEARPSWTALLRGQLQIDTLVVRDAVLPQQALAAIAAAARKSAPKGKSAPPTQGPDLSMLPRQIVLDRVAWVDAKGARTVVDAQAHLDADHRPEEAEVQVTEGQWAGVRATLQREDDHWRLRAQIGGGTVDGRLQLREGGKGAEASLLEGQFDTRGVEVATFTAPSRTLTGRLEAHTTLRADLRDLGAVADRLRTQTRFTVHDAVVHGVDLAQAVKTVGIHRTGQTRLDTLAGQLITQGRAARLENMVASSGSLSANGAVAMAADQRLSGHVTVSLVGQTASGALGVPLVVGGTVDEPTVTLSRGALMGAAIGTVIAPGLGTGAGANVGDRMGQGLRRLFGGE